MDTRRINQTLSIHPHKDLIALTEEHLSEWFQLLDDLQDAHAPTDQLVYCRKEITRLQRNLYQLRNA
ncbi:hypothetical protein GCM10028818_10830 [Spirosoma horti]